MSSSDIEPSDKTLPSPPDAFARGWRSLPPELKVQILSYNLDTTQVLIQSMITRKQRWDNLSASTWANHPGAALLVAFREIVELAREVFYILNVCEMKLHSRSIRGHIWYPSRVMNRHIRRVEIEMILHVRYWKFLGRMATGELGFENLRDLKVTVMSEIIWNSREGKTVRMLKDLCSAMQTAPIVFVVDRLAIDFVDPSASYSLGAKNFTVAEQARNKMVEAEVKPLLLRSITAKMKEEKRTRSSTIDTSSGASLETQSSVIEVMRYLPGENMDYTTTNSRTPVWTRPQYGSIGWKHTIKIWGQNEDDRKLIEQAQEGGN